MASYASHWWHAPIYITISLVLVAVIIKPPYTTTNTTTDTPTTSTVPNTTLPLPLNATHDLISHGFAITAILLTLFPSHFPPRPFTLFAINDTTAISSHLLALPSPSLITLLHYHSLPFSSLSFQDLLSKPLNSCLTTSLPNKTLSVSGLNTKTEHLEINNITISHPNLYLSDNISIHGILSPFTPLTYLPSILSPPCTFVNSSSGQTQPDFALLVRALSANGFVSFAVGLNSVLDPILEDNPGLGPVTVFAPPEFGFVGSSGPFLERVVRYHIVKGRYPFSVLGSLHDDQKGRLVTLLGEEALEVTKRSDVNGSLAVNGVEIVMPDVLSAEMFVVHGISRAFDFCKSCL